MEMFTLLDWDCEELGSSCCLYQRWTATGWIESSVEAYLGPKRRGTEGGVVKRVEKERKRERERKGLG